MKTPRLASLFLALFTLLMLLPTGCTQSLFEERRDPAVDRKRYFDNESVVGSRERRRQTQEAGFGFSQGPSAQ